MRGNISLCPAGSLRWTQSSSRQFSTHQYQTNFFDSLSFELLSRIQNMLIFSPLNFCQINWELLTSFVAFSEYMNFKEFEILKNYKIKLFRLTPTPILLDTRHTTDTNCWLLSAGGLLIQICSWTQLLDCCCPKRPPGFTQ